MNVDSCLRRPLSKERQFSKVSTFMHNLVRVEGKKVVNGISQSDRGGHFSMHDRTTLKIFGFFEETKDFDVYMRCVIHLSLIIIIIIYKSKIYYLFFENASKD